MLALLISIIIYMYVVFAASHTHQACTESAQDDPMMSLSLVGYSDSESLTDSDTDELVSSIPQRTGLLM